MNTPTVEAWSATPRLLSEGPRWHEERQERQPDAGRVFAIDGLEVRGLPCMPYRGRLPVGGSR